MIYLDFLSLFFRRYLADWSLEGIGKHFIRVFVSISGAFCQKRHDGWSFDFHD
jgi:hypothetical protein